MQPFPIVIFAGSFSDAAVHDVYTVPSGKVVVLRGIFVSNGSGSDNFFRVYFTRSGVNYPIMLSQVVASSGTFVDDFYVTYYPGDKVSVAATGAGLMAYVLNGSERDTP